MLRKCLAASVAAAALIAVSPAAWAKMPQELNFGIISTESSQALKTGFELV